jgi:STE24 endopeptidase
MPFFQINKELDPALWKNHDRSIKKYLWWHRGLGILQSVVSLGFVLFLLFKFNPGTGFSIYLYRGETTFWAWALFFILLFFIFSLLSLPFSFFHQLIEKRHALSKQTWKSWIWDWCKGILLGVVFISIALAWVHYCLSFGKNWWVGVATGLLVFSVVLAELAPILLIPLFFKMEPMAPSALKERLLLLCRKYGISVKEVYHLGMGDKTEKGNAAFMGLGRNKRIVIGDTLYKKFPEEEVEAVFGHELGHQVHNDVWKGLLLSSVFLYFTFFLADQICIKFLLPHYGLGLYHPFGFFLFLVCWRIVQIPFSFFQTLHTRYKEWEADRFASRKLGLGTALASALERLTLQNRTLFRPNPWIEMFTYSHPSPGRRVTALRNN